MCSGLDFCGTDYPRYTEEEVYVAIWRFRITLDVLDLQQERHAEQIFQSSPQGVQDLKAGEEDKPLAFLLTLGPWRRDMMSILVNFAGFWRYGEWESDTEDESKTPLIGVCKAVTWRQPGLVNARSLGQTLT